MAAEEVGTTDVAEMEARWSRQVWPEMEEVAGDGGSGGGGRRWRRQREWREGV
jgi:hypothetical protein